MTSASHRRHLIRFWLALPWLAPAALWQGLRVRRTAPRLPPRLPDIAVGEFAGPAPPYRLLLVGESTAVGVGASSPEASLAPQLAGAIGRRLDRAVAWQVIGENGIRAAALARKIAERPEPATADLAVIVLGANDTSGFSSLAGWRRDLTRTVELLRRGCPRVCIAPVPPFHGFRLLPQPLRWLLGERALALCAVRHELAAPGVTVMDAEFPREARYLAEDGYHPSDLAYREWAGQIAGLPNLINA